MKVTRIYHSSVFIETEKVSILIDYYRGELPKIDKKKPLFIFASHGHGDHFSRTIFRLSEGAMETHYILSGDIPHCPEMEGHDCHFMEAGEELRFPLGEGELTVRSLKSNDLGIAFLLELPDFRIYHAGDLNNWWWDGDSEDKELAKDYHRELQKIKGESFDLAFVPLDPRLKGYERGVLDFLDYVNTRYLVPIHFSDDAGVISRFKESPYFEKVAKRCQFVEDRELREFSIEKV